MQCKECEILEMRVAKVVDGVIYYECKKCGRKETQTVEELENKEA